MIPKKLRSRIHSLSKKAYKIIRSVNKNGVLVALLIAGTLMGGFITYLIVQDQSYHNKIYPGIYVDNHNVGGKTKEDVINLYKPVEANLHKVNVAVFYNKEQIATISAEQLKLNTNVQDVAEQAYLVGRSTHFPSNLKQKLLLLTGLNTYQFKPVVQYDKKPFDQFIRQTAESYDRAPRNAKFSFQDDKVVTFEDSKSGSQINKEDFFNEINKAMDEVKKNPTSKNLTKKIVLKEEEIQPDITLADANSFGIEELIGEGKSDYSGSSEDRVYNLSLAASKFHGVLIPPGEEFSFNKIVGDISTNTGYRPAYIIQNGKTVLGDGGGVCQVSTTAFRAALNTGLPITERHAHAYRVAYYENDSKPGFDATIYTPSVDLRFKNDTLKHMLVQIENDRENRLLYFRFYGKKDNRRVELSEPVVWDVAPPPPDKHEDDPNLPNGQIKQIDFAAWGAKSKFTYKVIREGQILIDEEYVSAYRPWQAVFLVGKGG